MPKNPTLIPFDVDGTCVLLALSCGPLIRGRRLKTRAACLEVKFKPDVGTTCINVMSVHDSGWYIPIMSEYEDDSIYPEP
jgi:hypothetical protein